MDKIRVLHIISDTNIGGAGKLIANLEEAINKDKFTFLYILNQGSAAREIFDKERTYTIKNSPDRSLGIKAALEVRQIIRDIQPDIIHTHSAFYGKLGAKLAGVTSAKVIYTKHCVFDIPKIFKFRIIRYIYRMIDNLFCKKIVAVAQSAKNELIGYGVDPKKIDVIINGVSQLPVLNEYEKTKVKNDLGIHRDKLIIGINARLEEYKGHKTLIDAAYKLKKEGIDDVLFLFLGDGSYKKELMRYVKELKLDKMIVFLGFQKDVYKYVNLFDVNVNCSVGTETSSLAISEGLSLGKPVIATNYGGNPNMVKNGKTGFIFDKCDSDQLLDKILKLKNDKDLYSKMSIAAEEDFINRFCSTIMAKQYEKVYNNILCGKNVFKTY